MGNTILDGYKPEAINIIVQLTGMLIEAVDRGADAPKIIEMIGNFADRVMDDTNVPYYVRFLVRMALAEYAADAIRKSGNNIARLKTNILAEGERAKKKIMGARL